jgi:hypothetical protein
MRWDATMMPSMRGGCLVAAACRISELSHACRVSQVCEHRGAWTVPKPGKTMPIAMVIQLGDLVERS